MSRFPTAGHLVSWAKLCPRTIQSGRDPARRQDRQGQPVSQRGARRGRRRGCQNGHLPRRTLPAHRQTARQTQSPRRCRPLDPGHHLEPAQRPHRPVPRPRRGLPRHPHQHRTQNPQPRRATDSDGLPRHPRTRRLNQIHTGPTRPGSASSAGYCRLPTHPGYFPVSHRGPWRGRAQRVKTVCGSLGRRRNFLGVREPVGQSDAGASGAPNCCCEHEGQNPATMRLLPGGPRFRRRKRGREGSNGRCGRAVCWPGCPQGHRGGVCAHAWEGR